MAGGTGIRRGVAVVVVVSLITLGLGHFGRCGGNRFDLNKRDEGTNADE